MVDKLQERGKNPEDGLSATGVGDGCERAIELYFGMTGFVASEAAFRLMRQPSPFAETGGFAGFVSSILDDGDKFQKEQANADMYWTHVAFVHALIQLHGEQNAYNSEYEKQLVEGGAQPAVIGEMRIVRREVLDILTKRYEAIVRNGLKVHGPPRMPSK